MGGVLVDYHTLEYYTARGYSPDMARKLADVTMGSPYWAQFDIGLMPYNWILDKMKSLDSSLSQEIEKSLRRQEGIVTRRSESKDWIETFRRCGYRVLVLSNFSKAALRDCAQALDYLGENLGGTGKIGTYGVISEGILSCDVHAIKPYPAIYAILLTRYGLIPEETVFVDDVESNLAGARPYGIHTVLFQSRDQVLEDIEKLQSIRAPEP